MRALGGCALAALLLAGCQSDEPVAGDVATTPRALAWIAAEHLGTPSSAAAEEDAAEEFGSGGIGAELSIGQQLVVAVGTDLPAELYDCDSQETGGLAGCEETDEGVLMWEDEEPAEDPGVVYVVVPKGDSAVLLFGSGEPVTGDPRDLDLPVTVAQMFELAQDPRVDVTTTQEAVDGGRALDWWE